MTGTNITQSSSNSARHGTTDVQPENKKLSGHDLWQFAYAAFLRLLAVFFIIFSIQIWMQVIGVGDNPQLRFDTMPAHWRLAVAALSVLHPVTALGLWGLFPWGIAVWLIDVAVLLTMHVAFIGLFGFDQTLVIFHLLSLAVFAIFQLSLRFTTNKS